MVSSTFRRVFVFLFIFATSTTMILLYMTNFVIAPRSIIVSTNDTTKQKLEVQFVQSRNEPNGRPPSFTHPTSNNFSLVIPRISAPVQSTTRALRSKPNSESNSKKMATLATLATPERKVKPTPRPRSCTGCMQHNFEILLLPEPCQSSRIPEIVFVVNSLPGNTLKRHAIRNSWGTSSTIPLRTVFLFGSPKDATYNAKLKLESDQFGDILQEDFVDSYGNLTYKTMMAFKWVKNNCRQTKYVFKTDDDMWVNVKEFHEQVRELQMQDKIGGTCFQVGKPLRNPYSKWYASSMQYPESTYPGFCTGTAYFMTANTAVKLFDISPNVPFFYLEDVYVGICAQRAGVKLLQVTGFYNYRVAPGDWCHYKQGVITSHGVSPDELLMLARKNCD